MPRLHAYTVAPCMRLIGNDGDDRSLRILEGVKAADVRDVGQWA